MTSRRIIVAGAGPAGCAVAAELARSGFHVSLHMAPPAARRRPGETLPAKCRPLLKRIGVLNLMEHDATVAYHAPRSEQFWGDNTHRFGPSSGWHIDREKFERILFKKAVDCGVEVAVNSVVDGVEPLAEGCRCEVRDVTGKRTRLDADFIVDATGRRGSVARSFGARIHSTDRLLAWQGLWEDAPEAPRSLVIEAQAAGWCYLVPLPGGKVSAGVVTDRDLLASSGHQSRPSRHTVGPQVAARLANCRPLVETAAWSAHSSITTPPFGSCWLAVGDAAACFDPLASCGILFALGSAFYAANAIRERFGRERETALMAYAWTLSRYCAAVQGSLAETYATETRWPDSPFWTRRQRRVETNEPAVFRDFSQTQQTNSEPNNRYAHILSSTR